MSGTKRQELISKIAQTLDPDAWLAIKDGRDAMPGSLWHIRRVVAVNKAIAVVELVRPIIRAEVELELLTKARTGRRDA